MHLKVSPPVSGDNFFPCPARISRPLVALDDSHVAFLGPRRTDKTACLRKVVSTPRSGYVPISAATGELEVPSL